jgi:hypothetical protein
MLFGEGGLDVADQPRLFSPVAIRTPATTLPLQAWKNQQPHLAVFIKIIHLSNNAFFSSCLQLLHNIKHAQGTLNFVLSSTYIQTSIFNNKSPAQVEYTPSQTVEDFQLQPIPLSHGGPLLPGHTQWT